MLTHSSSWQLLSVAHSLTNRWQIFLQNHAEAEIRTLTRPTAQECQERRRDIQGINYSEVSILQSLQAGMGPKQMLTMCEVFWASGCSRLSEYVILDRIAAF